MSSDIDNETKKETNSELIGDLLYITQLISAFVFAIMEYFDNPKVFDYKEDEIDAAQNSYAIISHLCWDNICSLRNTLNTLEKGIWEIEAEGKDVHS